MEYRLESLCFVIIEKLYLISVISSMNIYKCWIISPKPIPSVFLSAQIVKYLFKYIIRNYDNYEDINDCNTREGKKRYSDNLLLSLPNN